MPRLSCGCVTDSPAGNGPDEPRRCLRHAAESEHCYYCGGPVDEDDLDLGTMYAHRICRVLDRAETMRDERREA